MCLHTNQRSPYRAVPEFSSGSELSGMLESGSFYKSGSDSDKFMSDSYRYSSQTRLRKMSAAISGQSRDRYNSRHVMSLMICEQQR